MMDDAAYRFSIIPGWIVTDPRLKGRDLQVLCLLGRHTNKTDGWCRRSQVKMAAQLDCSRSTVQASLNRLVDMGAIEQRVVTSPDGRDSAHRYRVIYDREVASDANSAWDDEDSEDNIPMDGADVGTPPAGISAGGAGPESAPPADPESAPINDSCLTPPSNLPSADAQREDGHGSDRKKIREAFERWQKGWPGSGNLDYAKNAWFALSPEERAECIRLTPAYIARVGKADVGAPSSYLKNREWQSMPPEVVQPEKPALGVAKAFGKLWMGTRLATLDQPPTGLIHLTAFDERRIASGAVRREDVLREKRREHGWPLVREMADLARRRESFVTSLAMLPQVSAFAPVHRDSDLFRAWADLHARHDWPFFEHAPEWVYFPPVSDDADDLDTAVEDALATFLISVNEGRGNDDAA